MLLSPLNDTTLSSIRKSIFVYAAFVYVVYNYNVHVPPGMTFLGGIELGKGVKITQGDLLFVGALIQTYLLIRLALLVPVSLAVLEDEWGAETLKRNEELNKLVEKLKKETRDDAAKPWPQRDVSTEHRGNRNHRHLSSDLHHRPDCDGEQPKTL